MKRTMLIDAAHAEEVRVCVLENGAVEDFDFESSQRKPLRGNIYLARVTRVEPSLQAAFVEYGGNRHGFLAFNEIHPDYYQIPVSDRRLLQEAEAEEAALAAELDLGQRDDDEDGFDGAQDLANGDEAPDFRDGETNAADAVDDEDDDADHAEEDAEAAPAASLDAPRPESLSAESEAETDEPAAVEADDDAQEADESSAKAAEAPRGQKRSRAELLERYKDARRKRARLVRNYKIQEVVKRRQILLVQVVKEERGNKGAALTTYLSLAGRYCVLMPNTARGGGISRKIPVAADRKKLRRIVDSLDVPQGIGLIIRTAGAKRTKAEIKRDYDYLIRLWENIRALTLKSIAPCLIYEEANLIKRAIRDLYDKDIDQVLVEGEAGYREAKDFMKMLMPSHAKNVQPYKEKTPLFLRYDVENQLDAMYQPTVRLKSGGYLVIHQTEALVAIDVNSGKATRERNIELTALKTNLEAAREAARQCRLRDLAGLIVIDFIDMEENKNNRSVEKRLKDALKIDRARIQVGRISNFGLLEMSRQRRRSGLVEGTSHSCPTCGGAGVVRSAEMASLRILRALESQALAARAGVISIKASTEVALYILNYKRDWLKRIEDDYALSVEILADPGKAGDQYDVERRGVPRELPETPAVIRANYGDDDQAAASEPEISAEDDDDLAASEEQPETGESAGEGGRKRRRRRRRRRDGEPRQERTEARESAGEDADEAEREPDGEEAREAGASGDNQGGDGQRKRRRRGRRGGRRNNRRPEQSGEARAEEQSALDPESADALAPNAPALLPDEAPALESAEEPLSSPEAPAVEREEEEPLAATPAEQDSRPSDAVQLTAEEAEENETPAQKPARKGWWQRAIGG